MRIATLVASAALAMLVVVGAAHAEKRVALVIGNGAYQNAPALPNPPHDAGDVAASLRGLGFEVTELSDASFDRMRRAFVELGRRASDADMAVVFFAGHGMEVGRENWLIPVDAELRRDADAEAEAIGLHFVMAEVAGARRLGLVILDSCRNNPFAARMIRTSRDRAVDRGLARVEPNTDNVAVAFAARDGTTATDGNGRNSPFTAALLKHLDTPGLEVRFLFASVRDDVMAATHGEQQPFLYQSLPRQELFLAPPAAAPPVTAAPAPGPAAPSPTVDPCAVAADHWRSTETIGTLAAYEDHLARFPNCAYAGLAQIQIARLKKGPQVAAVAPPVAPAVPPASCGGGPVTASLSSRAPCPLTEIEERSLKPKDLFKECDKCPEMVVVPAGRFMMGSPSDEDLFSTEGPQHWVFIARPFAVGKFHVTVDQFAAFVAETGYDAGSQCTGAKDSTSWRSPGFVQGGTHPVVCINWNDAEAFVRWLARKTGKDYRLLSEAEWEYAARAGSTTRYSFGNDVKDLCRYGNGSDQTLKNSKIAFPPNWVFVPCSDGYVYTAPAGSFAANEFALYDMQGNAFQWLEDCYNQNYVGASSDGGARTSGDCSQRMVRGGDWQIDPWRLRPADRAGRPADNHEYEIGFRVARTLATPVDPDVLAAAQPQGISDLAKKVAGAVVQISAVQNVGPRSNAPAAATPATSVGSGFIIDPTGLVVTASHLVADAGEITVILDDGTRLKATLIGKDSRTDLALLRVNHDKALKSVKFSDPGKLHPGDLVLAIGNSASPSTVAAARIMTLNDVTAGPFDSIRTDATLDRGSSGGPLFNLDGEVAGMNLIIYSASGSAADSFAVPSRVATVVIDQLRQFGEVPRAWLGVKIQPVTDEIAEVLDLKQARGALVAEATDRSPARIAGIESGDVIIKFDGHDTNDARDLARAVADTPIGKNVEIVLIRKGQEISKTVTLGRYAESDNQVAAAAVDKNTKPPPRTVIRKVQGLDLATITGPLRKTYQINEGVNGVVVTGVDADSSAANRVSPGDVIVGVTTDAVTTVDAVQQRINLLKKEGRKGALLHLRATDGSLRFVVLSLQ